MTRKAVYLDLSIPLFEKESDLNEYKLTLDELSKSILKSVNIKYYCYLPLETLNLIGSNAQIIYSLKNLMSHERVQFIISGNFNTVSPLMSEDLLEVNCLLSEYLVSYLFGDLKTFEGESAVVGKNLTTYSPFKNVMNINDISRLNAYGYSSFILSESICNETFINGENIFIRLNLNIQDLFNSFIDLKAFKDWAGSMVGIDYEVLHFPAYELLKTYKDTFKINLTNFFHLLDHEDGFEFSFVDESFLLSIKKDIAGNLMDMNQKDFILSNYRVDTDLLNLQERLSAFVKPSLLDNFERIFENNDDFRNIPLWEASGNKLIDGYLKFTYLILTLLSFSIHDKINLLNKGFLTHVSSIINELKIYSTGVEGFAEVLKDYSDYINQKLPN